MAGEELIVVLSCLFSDCHHDRPYLSSAPRHTFMPGRLACRERPALAADAICELCWVAGTLHLNAGNRTFNFRKIASAQLHGSGTDILLQPMQLGGSRDGNDPGLLSEQPGKSNLRVGYALLCGDLAQHIDERLVGLAVLFVEARHHVAKVRLIKGGVCVDGSSQKALAERAEGDEADSQLFERRQDFLLRLAPP